MCQVTGQAGDRAAHLAYSGAVGNLVVKDRRRVGYVWRCPCRGVIQRMCAPVLSGVSDGCRVHDTIGGVDQSASAGSSWADHRSSDPLACARGSDQVPKAGVCHVRLRCFAIRLKCHGATDVCPRVVGQPRLKGMGGIARNQRPVRRADIDEPSGSTEPAYP